VCVCVCFVLDCKKRQFARRDQSCIKSRKETVWNSKENVCLVLHCKRRRSEFGTQKKILFCAKLQKRKSEFGTRTLAIQYDLELSTQYQNCFVEQFN